MSTSADSSLPFDPHSLPRELKRHYISASEDDIEKMLHTIGMGKLEELYTHMPAHSRFKQAPHLPEELDYDQVRRHLLELSQQNRIRESFIGDALPHYQVTPVIEPVCAIRNLTTSYTPYQPERSQGTLITHWIYQCLMSQLTGFEAVNSSLYDRSTALFEAMATAVRLSRKGNTIVLSEGIFPQDREVLDTLIPGTGIHVRWIPLTSGGLTDVPAMATALAELGQQAAAFVFPHVNHFGLLENVDQLADLKQPGVTSIAVVDPALLATGGLKPPSEFGASGVDMIVGEAQHLAIGPNFGGPGLGLFAVRFNEKDRNAIRQTPGRYVGKARDRAGRDCHVMVMSTREQHIRKDKATSNICSNQAFLATLAGAALLCRGDDGLSSAFISGHDLAREAAGRITALPGFQLAFPESVFVNEIVLQTTDPVVGLIRLALQHDIHLGVDVSDRDNSHRHLLKLSFTDRPVNLDRLVQFFESVAGQQDKPTTHPQPELSANIPKSQRRSNPAGILKLPAEEIVSYYQQLGELNVSPDDACFPLGSCTMKYNPYINDWAAALTGFSDLHPQAPIEDAQGSLRVLYEIQEWFKKITGLAGVTTQPVAGAQGELVGIKLFQAYLKDHGQAHRDVVLIPASAHGTNFATAVMAGYRTRKADGRESGIVLLQSGPDGCIDMDDLRAKVDLHRDHLAAVMITNPNTCGIFEKNFKDIADLVHGAGGLVYMDGANMNAIAGWCDLGGMGVDAVHNNLHKTWTIPHGGGGPGDAIVAVSEKLLPYLPGYQIVESEGKYIPEKPAKSIGSFHRHWGNFAHKVRAYTYLVRLGKDGVRRMPAVAVLSARYCLDRLRKHYSILPARTDSSPRMHEFILTLHEEDFKRLEAFGIAKGLAIPRIGKLFLDFGFHAPTVAWPEPFGLMVEPTESYTMEELNRFCEAVIEIRKLIEESPEVLNSVPHFTPIDRVDEVEANRRPEVSGKLTSLPEICTNRLDSRLIASLPIGELADRIKKASQPIG